MNSKLKAYIPLLDFLVEYLGEDTEVVLQDFTNGFDNSVVYIKNNLSGREVGAPTTDFVLDVFKSKIYLEKDYLVNYRTKTLLGKELHSSTFFIKDEENLIGMICLNSDKSKYTKLKTLLEEGLGIIDNKIIENSEIEITNSNEITETFYSNSDHLIEATIVQETQGKDLTKFGLNKDEKIAIVRSLYEKGFFNLKNSVEKVAESFGMSEVSIYKYIQQIKSE